MFFNISNLEVYIKLAKEKGCDEIRFDRPEIYVRKRGSTNWKPLN